MEVRLDRDEGLDYFVAYTVGWERLVRCICLVHGHIVPKVIFHTNYENTMVRLESTNSIR